MSTIHRLLAAGATCAALGAGLLTATAPAQAAVASARVTDGVLTIQATHTDTSIRLDSVVGGVRLTDYQRRTSTTHRGVSKVVFRGWLGDDVVRGSGLRVPLEADGGWGDDTLIGGSATDRLVGNRDNDRLYGNSGRDTLVGGHGRDYLSGGNDDDWIVGLDNTRGDTLRGGSGRDIFWTDSIAGATDALPDDRASEAVHRVTAFANGPDRTLDGDRIADPAVPAGKPGFYVSRRSSPLWSNSTASGVDVFQGSLSDCKVVSALSAVAHNTVSGNAWPVRKALVDFGDGTYGAAFNGSFYRVDGDLMQFVNRDGERTLTFAREGRGGAIWVPIAEKALAVHDSRLQGIPATYGRLASTAPATVFQAFGSPSALSPRTNSYATSATDLGNKLFRAWSRYDNVTLSLLKSMNSVGGTHAYTVWNVRRNQAGVVTAIQLRNPWGRDGSSNGYNDGNPDDGLVTYTPAQIWAATPQFSRVNWGTRIR